MLAEGRPMQEVAEDAEGSEPFEPDGRRSLDAGDEADDDERDTEAEGDEDGHGAAPPPSGRPRAALSVLLAPPLLISHCSRSCADAASALGRRLVVVGPARDAALVAELERRGAELRGYVPKQELVRLYQQAACVVLPSRYEGFGLPMLEAMACGTPVAAANDPAMREVGGEAVVFGDDVTESVRHALAERDRLSRVGIERAREFTWEETARRTAQVYREAIAA